MKLQTMALFSMLAAGCASIDTNARVAPGADLAQYHTWAWAQNDNGAAPTVADQAIKDSLAQNLAQKGLVPATNGPADFLIAFHTATQQQTRVSPGSFYGYYAYGYPDVYTYTEGTLIVDFVDARTHKVFWRGTASGTAEHPDNPDPKRVAGAVDKLMEKYPQQVAATPRPTM